MREPRSQRQITPFWARWEGVGKKWGQFPPSGPVPVHGTLSLKLPLTLNGMKINALTTGALLAAIAVALGAFGAHALKTRLDPQMLANFETGVRYQMYAALALMVLGTQIGQTRAPLLLLLGTIVFSGSLYLLAITGIKWLGAITPIGGVLLIVGLVLAAIDAGK